MYSSIKPTNAHSKPFFVGVADNTVIAGVLPHPPPEIRGKCNTMREVNKEGSENLINFFFNVWWNLNSKQQKVFAEK